MPDATPKPLSYEIEPADAAILARLIVGKWEQIAADTDISPGARIDALKAALPGLSEAASACRMALSIISDDSHPLAVTKRAADNVAAAEAKAAAQRARGQKLARQIEERTRAGAVTKAAADLAEAEAVADRLVKSDAPPREVVLARGAVQGGRLALAEARAALDEIRKQGAGGRP